MISERTAARGGALEAPSLLQCASARGSPIADQSTGDSVKQVTFHSDSKKRGCAKLAFASKMRLVVLTASAFAASAALPAGFATYFLEQVRSQLSKIP